MADRCILRVDGKPLEAAPGESLAVALLRAGHWQFRRSCTGEARAPFCAMGTCYECQVKIDGAWARACLVPVRDGLEVSTHD